MSNAKEIRTKIRSVQNTQKITRAMEMVAASKMRRAQERMAASRPYSDRIRAVIKHLSQAHPEYHHPYLDQARTVRNVGYIIVSTDRGLCGGLNANLFRALLADMRAWQEQQVGVKMLVIGSKASGFFRRYGGELIGELTNVGDQPKLTDLIGDVKIMLDDFNEESIDRLYLASNNFVNTMTQRPSIEQLLPIPPGEEEELQYRWDYLYEPDPAPVLDQLLQRFVEAQVYQGVVENIACEQAARMVAMKAASDNAEEIIDQLQLAYNKARQAAITQELSEIVAGANAV